jgi:hypothetical protein
MPSWAWFLVGLFAGAPVGFGTFGLLSSSAFQELEAKVLELRHENRRLKQLLSETVTDWKDAA